MTPTTKVQLIGRRASFRDHLYGTGLVFEQGQARELPPDVARKFLRHQDLFRVAADGVPVQTTVTQEPPSDDGTAAALEQAARETEAATAKERERQDLIDTITHMPKAGLIEFARNNYRQELDKAQKVDELRAQVRGFVDQFGMV